MSKDFFAEKASTYEQDRARVDNVKQIATAILNAIKLHGSLRLMDFGAGTGLLLGEIAPYVGKITAVDVSPAMTAQLREKLDRLACPVEILQLDLESTALDRKFDGIISSMTLHHVKDVPRIFETFYSLLHDGGFIALADLDREDGSFHSQDTGVHHAGFEREALCQTARAAGFREVTVVRASTLHKHGRDYGVFLLSALR
jgi:cyclopropane fatty-acyl-phospholipid synthase-like methyltransferase